MTPIEELRKAFAQVNARLMLASLGDSVDIKRTADDLERRLGLGRAPDKDAILITLQKFLRTGVLAGYREIKTACYGILLPIRGSVTIAAQPLALETLMKAVDPFQNEPKRLKRCFQAVMGTFFSLDGFDENSSMHPQWIMLRHRLSDWLPNLDSFRPAPEWLAAARQHRELFGNQPTEKFGARVLAGAPEEFESACAQLSVPPHSWIRRQVVISAIDFATFQNDSGFIAHLGKALELLRVNSALRTEGVTKLLNRYAVSEETPEHIPLRATALEIFGNPLIIGNKPRWFAVSGAAQEMVAAWLKGFLIERFFELLSQDGRTDRRRPEFWLRHRNSIENMWFVLGPSATDNSNEDFKKLRSAMGNQCLMLDGASPGNNAFIMKLGSVYVVEFGEKGNATYLFDGSGLPFVLSGARLDQSALKSDQRQQRLVHRDGAVNWEYKFSTALARHHIVADDIGSRPRHESASRRAGLDHTNSASHLLRDFRKMCNERGIRYDDRAPSGRLVAYVGADNTAISRQLAQWGFAYEPDHQRWVRRG